MDFSEGIKKEVAEIKFLIHDLRVEKFINEIVHFHATLNTDLEIYDIEQAQVMHNEDLNELKKMALASRKALKDYSNAVKSFSPAHTIILLGKNYIQTIQEICELVLNPLWGRFDKVMSFLPAESRSARSRSHYRNGVRWLCGVYYRIDYFFKSLDSKEGEEEFDIAADIFDFTHNVIYGYVTEKSGSRMELQMGDLQPAIIAGNRPRFRRMFFNLVMNSVDAMSGKKVGIINISTSVLEDKVELVVRDDGNGMPQEKIKQLLGDRSSLDGELHSLGFVFVKQTIDDFQGELHIKSDLGKGTKITVSLPRLPHKDLPPPRKSRCEKYRITQTENIINSSSTSLNADASNENVHTNGDPVKITTEKPDENFPIKQEALDRSSENIENDKTESKVQYGEVVFADYEKSEAQFPGSIFAMSIDKNQKVEFFSHKPYEKYWNISHEDLSPMFYLAVVRGRIEENDLKQAELILKAPQSVFDYFEFKELPEDQKSQEKYLTMVREEYIQVAKTLMLTGLDSNINVMITDGKKFFPDEEQINKPDKMPLHVLANWKV